MTIQSQQAFAFSHLPTSLVAALNLCHDCVFIVDAKARVLFANTQFARVTGMAVQDIVGKELGSCAYGKHFLEHDPAVARSIASGLTWRGEVRSVNAKGQEIWGRVIFAPVAEERLQKTVMVVVSEDITEDKQAMNAMASPDMFGDPMLGVPFIVFMDRLHQALRRSGRDAKQVGVVCLEFAALSGCADNVCQTILAAIRKCLRRLDTAVRLDGMKFAIILEDLINSQSVHLVLERILDALGRLRQEYGEPLPRVFMGVAVHPEHGGDADTLFDNARSALAQAKKQEDVPYVLAR